MVRPLLNLKTCCSPCHYGWLFPWLGSEFSCFPPMRIDSFLAVCRTDVHLSSSPLACPAVWLGWLVCCSAPVALFALFLSFFLSALFVHPPGTYYVEAPSGPRCLKNEDKVLISLPICKLRSHSTVMVDTVRRLKD